MDKYISLKDCLKELNKYKYALPIILGKDPNNDIHIKDLKDLKNILIVGYAGMGKSVFIESLLFTLIYTNSPDKLKFLFMDLMGGRDNYQFSNLPHLFNNRVICMPDEAIEELKKCNKELERREKSNVIQPYLLIVIDEFADISLNYSEFAELIQPLLERGNKVGIYLVLSTVNRFKETFSEEFKEGFNTRIVFATDKEHSKLIIGKEAGALLEDRGEIIYKDMDSGNIERIQTPYIWEEEIMLLQKISKNPEEKIDISDMQGADTKTYSEEIDYFALYEDAKKIVIESKKASPSFLQRKLKIGYNHAARLIEKLEKDGIVSSASSVNQRRVLIDKYEEPIGK